MKLKAVLAGVMALILVAVACKAYMTGRKIEKQKALIVRLQDEVSARRDDVLRCQANRQTLQNGLNEQNAYIQQLELESNRAQIVHPGAPGTADGY